MRAVDCRKGSTVVASIFRLLLLKVIFWAIGQRARNVNPDTLVLTDGE